MDKSSNVPARAEEISQGVSPLTAEQQAALLVLFSGKKMREAAVAARIHRNTLSRWLHSDPHFLAAYNAWRRELIDSTRAKLLHTAELATSALHRAIAKGDGRLALALLDRLGLASPAAASAGPTDPARALDEIVIEANEDQSARNRRFKATLQHDARIDRYDASELQSLRDAAIKLLPAPTPDATP
jgi:hypothetical protein